MSPETVFQALAAGTPLLTATQRLARSWHGRYDAWQQGRGTTAWPSADVLPLGAWVGRLFEDVLDAAALPVTGDPPAPAAGARTGRRPGAALLLLSASQERRVWEQVLEAAEAGAGLLRGAALARSAQEAYRRLSDWQLPLPVPAPADPVEWRAFAEWAGAFQALCAREGWADGSLRGRQVLAALASGALRPPAQVLVAGFDVLTPHAAALLDALRAAGCAVVTLPQPERGQRAVRCALPDMEAEAQAAARWARHWVEREPHARIGIVVPDLADQRDRWERVLADVLQPGAVLPEAAFDRAPPPAGTLPAGTLPATSLSAAGPGPAAFNLSEGRPLTHYPVVATALRMLGWRMLGATPAALPLDDWSALLRSPFLAGAEGERDARALLDVRLRRRGSAELTPRALAAAARSPGGQADGSAGPAAAGEGAPLLAEVLQRWQDAAAAQPERQAPSAWAVGFAALLDALGWPGERGVDSTEFQTVQVWHEVLEELARLDPVAPVITRGDALGALRRMASERVFQPEGSEAPVQVLGVLESGGLEFDHLWVAGLHEDAWPLPARPSALLPLAMQRRNDMPRASAARELELARRETGRLCQAAPDVVFSHPMRQADHPLRPSALLRALPEVDASALPAATTPTLRTLLAASATLEPLADPVAPPIAAGSAVRGGTGLFADQAACPFRAFAHHRLHARAPEAPEPGLDDRQRGSLVHDALEHLWRRLGGLEALRALDAAALTQTLAESATAAVAAALARDPERLGTRQAGVERSRLGALLGGWLEVERRRAPFTVVAQEEAHTLDIGGISVQGRVDRMDRLADGRHVLIDYKTGSPRSDAWWGARPDEPQLPLYAISTAQPLAGVVFAQVAPGRRQRARFRGVGDEAAALPEASPLAKLRLPAGAPPPASMGAVLADWRAALEGLAGEFRAGMARVDPKRTDSCRYCDLPGLCRIAELRPALAWGEAGGEGEGAGDDPAPSEGADG